MLIAMLAVTNLDGGEQTAAEIPRPLFRDTVRGDRTASHCHPCRDPGSGAGQAQQSAYQSSCESWLTSDIEHAYAAYGCVPEVKTPPSRS